MVGIYDHMQAQLAEDEPAGISPLDLVDLPAAQKQIILALLHNPSPYPGGATGAVTEYALREKLEGKTEGRTELFDEALALLIRSGWLIMLGDAPNRRYRLNFRAKRAGAIGFNLWTILTDRLPKGPVSTDAT